MKTMTSAEVRQMFLDFFKSKGHTVEPSQSLVPVNDPTLLWINSGVATLKKYFDGSVVPENPRLTNAQKAIRTNDMRMLVKQHVTILCLKCSVTFQLGIISVKKRLLLLGNY